MKTSLLLLLAMLALPGVAADVDRFEEDHVLYTIRPAAEKVAAYREKLAKLFEEFKAPMPKAPVFGCGEVQGYVGTLDQLQLSRGEAGFCEFMTYPDVKSPVVLSVRAPRGFEDQSLLLARGNKENPLVSFLRFAPGSTVTVIHDYQGKNIRKREWRSTLGFLREQLGRPVKPFKTPGTTVTFFSLAYSQFTLEIVRELLEQGVRIDEIAIHDIAVEYVSGEEPRVNVFYNEENLSSNCISSVFWFAVSPTGGLASKFSIFIARTDE